MSKFMPHSVQGNFDPAGTVGHTHLLGPAFNLTQVAKNIGKLDPNAQSSYTAIDETTAFLKFYTKLISEIDPLTLTINPNSEHHEYLIRYMMISTLILISGMKNEIDCELSYLRIDCDEYSPYPDTDQFRGEKYIKNILDSWAEYLDDKLISFDSNQVTPTRMLRVVKLNGVPVAYYTSRSNRIGFYPFKTIVSDEEMTTGLTGITVDENTYEWRFNYNDFIGNILETLSKDQKNILAAVFQSYANIPSTGNGFRLLMKELGLKVPVGGVPLEGEKAVGRMLPVKLRSYLHPEAGMLMQDFPCANKLEDLLKVPHVKKTDTGVSDSIFYALGYTLPRCQVFTQENKTWLMVASVSDNIRLVYVDGTDRKVIEPKGIEWKKPNTEPVRLDIEYVDSNSNTVPLGSYVISDGGEVPPHKLFTWDSANLQLICACIPPKTISPFLDKFWSKVSEYIMPVTKECIDLLEENNCRIGDYTAVGNTVSFKIVDGNDTTLEVVSRTYSDDELVPDEYNDGIDVIYTEMPRITVFPYCRFTYNGEEAWNKYYFTAIAESNEYYRYFRRIKLQYKKPGGVEYHDMKFTPKSLLDKGKKTFIAYRCFMELIPRMIFLSDEYGHELGVITIKEPEVKDLDPNKRAVMGVDMGSRNSIVAYYQANSPMYFYNYPNLVHSICNSYIPENEDEWEELLNLHGLSGDKVEKSFTSAVLDYMDAPASERKNPMEHGRIIADLSENSFKKIIKLAEMVTTPTDDNNKLAEIGYHSNFKRELWDADDSKSVPAHVALFVKNLCYRLLLNAFMQRCGTVELRYTAPNAQVGDILKTYWEDSLDEAKEEFGLHKDLFSNILVSDYKLESVALYHHVQNNPSKLPYRYSIIIDGGDSTYDVSMIVKDATGKPHLCQNFSIKYAGYNLLVESITDVAMAKEYTLNDFVQMWVQKSGIRSTDGEREKIQALLEPVLKNGVINWDSSKSVEDVVYKLIEKTPNGLCKSSDQAKDVLALIKLKYLLLLNAILETCVDSIPDDNSNQPVSVFLYGGANKIAEMLYGDESKIKDVLGAKMTKWLSRYENSSKTPSVDLRYRVNPEKTELVSGLVQTNGVTSNASLTAVDALPKMYTQDTYDDIIKSMFDKNDDCEYWDSGTCLLDFPDITRLPELIGKPDEVMEQTRQMISGSLFEKINVPNRAVYPLATMLYAVRKFEETIRPSN